MLAAGMDGCFCLQPPLSNELLVMAASSTGVVGWGGVEWSGVDLDDRFCYLILNSMN
jgi:hypothetical protein